MTTVRYWTSHTNKSPNYWRDWFGLSESYNFEYDDCNPDYLLVSEHIYVNRNMFRKFTSLLSDKRLGIYIGGEAISPDLNLFDYACSFDRGLSLSGRIIRKPPVLFFKQHIFTPLVKGCDSPEEELKKKSKFCNFIYANPDAHPRRDQLFHVISQIGHVDSLGPHLNNVGNNITHGSQHWRELLVSMKAPYKFSIAAENASFLGYNTEKLISSFQARTVPIYWGDSSITEDYNPLAFVNANGLSDDELIDMVKHIDEDDSLWCKIISEPPITESQSKKISEEVENFYDFFMRIFDNRPIHQKKRAPCGFWNGIYKNFFERNASPLLIFERFFKC